MQVEEPSTGHWQGGTGEGEDDVSISDYKVCTETSRGEECNEKSIRELGAYSFFIFVSSNLVV